MLTLEEIKDRLGIEGTKLDAGLEALIKETIDEVQALTGRFYGEPKQVDEVFDGGGSKLIQLRQGPHLSEDPERIVRVFLRGDMEEGWEEEDQAKWELDDTFPTHLHHVDRWPDGHRNVRVNYWIGFPAGEEPPRIRKAVFSLIAGVVNELRKSGDLQSEKLGQYSYTKFGAEDTVWFRMATKTLALESIDRIG